MNNAAQDEKTDELDRLLNDPEVALDAGRIWDLAADLSRRANSTMSAQPREVRRLRLG